MDLKNYMDQHDSVKVEIKEIKKLINTNQIEEHAKEIALHISTLAGKIKVHLAMEDKYLYPGLLEKGNEQVKKMSVAYQKEMGDLAERFVAYKDQYNTAPKIINNLKNIVADTNDIFSKIEKRMQREEGELYKYI